MSTTDAPPKRKPRQKANIVKSGNSQKSTKPAVDPSLPPPLFPAGYKTPLSLLNEYCAKNKWERPSVDSHRSGSGFVGAVTLKRKNAKSSNGYDSVMLKAPSTSELAFKVMPTALEARHWGAIYALFRFGNKLQIQLTLPPNCRDYWKDLVQEKKQSPEKLAWLWEADPFDAAAQQEKASQHSRSATPSNSGQGPHSNNPAASGGTKSISWSNVPELRMSATMRETIEQVIRSSPAGIVGEVAGELLDEKETSILHQKLTARGFHPRHLQAAFTYIRTQSASFSSAEDAILNYLYTYLAEDELPPSEQHKPLESLQFVSHKSADDLALSWQLDELSKKTGFSRRLFDTVPEIAWNAGPVAMLDNLIRRLAGYPNLDYSQDAYSQDQIAATSISREEELMALESIYDEQWECAITSQEYRLTVQPRAPKQPHIDLILFFHPLSRYPSLDPSATPTFCVASDQLPSHVRLYLTKQLMEYLRTPHMAEIIESGAGGAISELANYLTEIWEDTITKTPSPHEVLANFIDTVDKSGPVPTSRSARPPKKPSRAYKSSKSQISSETLQHRFAQLKSTTAYANMLVVRQGLPAASMREQLLRVIGTNRVVVVTGETGSGKTTQVPSFVLEQATLDLLGANTNIVVTQPRRVSAISVATRVAQEWTQKVGEQDVGYSIRGERKASRNCRLLFCTTGILLQRLRHDPELADVSHVFIDECHERSIDSDICLMLLKDVLKINSTIKIILMSATANAAKFAGYFGGAPCCNIPGRTHPVQDIYLEDIVRTISYHAEPMKASRRFAQEEIDSMSESFRACGVTDETQISTLGMLTRGEKIDYQLIAAVVNHIVQQNPSNTDEAILVFVTGVAEIQAAMRSIRDRVSELEILPLHANLPPSEQAKVFRSYKGRRKVVVSTNVAETSITIPDCVYVIDTGRGKEMVHKDGMSRLLEDWIPQSAAKQRRGRAGRVRPGQCWKLYSRYTEQQMQVDFTPEILRTPLHSLVLHLKSADEESDPVVKLSSALDAPDIKAIREAVSDLAIIGAIESDNTLARVTGLGRQLSLLPLDLKLGKLLVLAANFGCLESALTIAGLLTAKPLFSSSPDNRDDAKSARDKYFEGNSDLLTDLNAYNAAIKIKAEDRYSAYKQHCESNYISHNAINEVESLRKDFLEALISAGVVNGNTAEYNKYATEINLLKALVFAAFGSLVKIKLPQARYEAVSSGTVKLDHEAKEVKFFERDGRVFLHPSSALFGESKYSTSFLTYFGKSITSKPFLRNASEVPNYGILLFSQGIKANLDKGLVTVSSGGFDDNWVCFKGWSRIVALVNGLRRLLDAELEAQLESNEQSETQSNPAVIEAIISLLARDGL